MTFQDNHCLSFAANLCSRKSKSAMLESQGKLKMDIAPQSHRKSIANSRKPNDFAGIGSHLQGNLNTIRRPDDNFIFVSPTLDLEDLELGDVPTKPHLRTYIATGQGYCSEPPRHSIPQIVLVIRDDCSLANGLHLTGDWWRPQQGAHMAAVTSAASSICPPSSSSDASPIFTPNSTANYSIPDTTIPFHHESDTEAT
ncbi:hypothetical protein BT63DRAFT_439540 [Microthyrium microscopicum]|uniref:Uncharacterized protein n=1 Tax=Microthyrium microscopicum TaxID=703497 RepID=A0A6A6UGG2_9PEZI|nr:hypothetical protein BT63DRAFT_439540 [Microthyrium microscopicum]